jgi:hypothetical protein
MAAFWVIAQPEKPIGKDTDLISETENAVARLFRGDGFL